MIAKNVYLYFDSLRDSFTQLNIWCYDEIWAGLRYPRWKRVRRGYGDGIVVLAK